MESSTVGSLVWKENRLYHQTEDSTESAVSYYNLLQEHLKDKHWERNSAGSDKYRFKISSVSWDETRPTCLLSLLSSLLEGRDQKNLTFVRRLACLHISKVQQIQFCSAENHRPKCFFFNFQLNQRVVIGQGVPRSNISLCLSLISIIMSPVYTKQGTNRWNRWKYDLPISSHVFIVTPWRGPCCAAILSTSPMIAV